MDIVYTLGAASRWDDNELRYSLRSLDKNGRAIRTVHIVGPYLPPWVKNVNFIYCEDLYKVKAKNIMLALIDAATSDDVSEDFLLSSDDHFYVRPTDFGAYPFFYKGALPCGPFTEEDGPGWGYHQQLFETALLLKKYGLTTHNFAQHCNTHFNKTVFRKYMPMMLDSLAIPSGAEATCLMLNAYLRERPFQWRKRTDIKITGAMNARDLKLQTSADHCFSIDDRAITRGIAGLLQRTFPTPSKYEI